MGEQQMGEQQMGEQQMGKHVQMLRRKPGGVLDISHHRQEQEQMDGKQEQETTSQMDDLEGDEGEQQMGDDKKGEAGTKRKSDTEVANYGGTDDSSDSEVPNYDKSGAGGSKGDSKSATGSDSKGGSKSGTGSDSKGKGGSQGKGDFAARLAKARQDLAGCDEQTLRDIIMCHDDGSEAII